MPAQLKLRDQTEPQDYENPFGPLQHLLSCLNCEIIRFLSLYLRDFLLDILAGSYDGRQFLLCLNPHLLELKIPAFSKQKKSCTTVDITTLSITMQN